MRVSVKSFHPSATFYGNERKVEILDAKKVKRAPWDSINHSKTSFILMKTFPKLVFSQTLTVWRSAAVVIAS